MPPPTPPNREPKPARSSRLWLVFVAVILLQLAAWTAWLIIASQNKVAEVPLVTAPHP
ncbi:MAG: hypothetical protein KA257_10390 [Opitutaceae bacterium]|nr:hypothetical protein [Opitutaceae bacterium]MBP9912086.1 hypothetical protein [Opitutaceae bacterium]